MKLCTLPDQALDAGTAAVLPEGLRAELEQLEDAGGVRHLQDLRDQIQVGSGLFRVIGLTAQMCDGLGWG